MTAGPTADKPYLSICAIYFQEGPYLREWIEFHRLVGVERFFLYDHESRDQHREVLAPYVEDGTVVLEHWPVDPGQLEAYEHCLAHHRDASRWMAFIDIDEFLFSPSGMPVPELLRSYERWPGVAACRVTFGSNGHETRPPGLVLESYTRRSVNPYRNRSVKSIVDPTRAIRPDGGHLFKYSEGDPVDEQMRPLEGPYVEPPTFRRLRINHYAIKSREEFERKLATIRPDTGTMREGTFESRERSLDELPDQVIASYLPALREAIGPDGGRR